MSVSLFVFPCSKGHSVRAYLDTIWMSLFIMFTLLLNCQTCEMYLNWDLSSLSNITSIKFWWNPSIIILLPISLGILTSLFFFPLGFQNKTTFLLLAVKILWKMTFLMYARSKNHQTLLGHPVDLTYCVLQQLEKLLNERSIIRRKWSIWL